MRPLPVVSSASIGSGKTTYVRFVPNTAHWRCFRSKRKDRAFSYMVGSRRATKALRSTFPLTVMGISFVS
jgi:hypothetical protein